MELWKDAFLTGSYIVHMLFEWFLCVYVFLLPKQFDIFYALYICLLIVLKFIFRYECIINFMDKKLVDPSYELGSDPKDIPFKRELYDNNSYLILFINFLIVLNLIILIVRNNSVFTRGVSLFNIIMWIFIEYKTQDYYKIIFV